MSECDCHRCCYARKHPQCGPAPHAPIVLGSPLTFAMLDAVRRGALTVGDDALNDATWIAVMGQDNGIWSREAVLAARARCEIAFNARNTGATPMTAPYGSPARILAFGGVPGAIHCGEHAEVYVMDRIHILDIIDKADAVGLDVVTAATTHEECVAHGGALFKLVATIRPEPPVRVHTTMRRMCDVMRHDLDAGIAEVALAWNEEHGGEA